jgi:hypothetical protein
MAQCGKCGSPLTDGQKFCGICGNVAAEQPAASAAVTPPPVPPPPPAFTPPAYPPQGYPPQGYQQPAAAWQAPKKSNKALWIGIAASVLVLAVAAILIFVVFWDQVSGKGGGGGSDASAQQMLAASWTASENAPDVAGTYDIAITMESDTSQTDNPMAGLLGGPITASGKFATTQSPAAVDLTVAASLFGQSIDAGLRLVDGTPYILFGGQWYETDPAMMQSVADSGATADLGALKALLTNLSIDPSAWLKDLKEAGNEDIDGVKSVHLTGSPDLVKMITDVTALMQSPEGQNLLGSASSLGDTSGVSTSIPTAEELAQMQTELDAILQDSTVDLWLSKEDNSLRKLAINLKIVPSAADPSSDLGSSLGELSTMFKSLTLSASVTLASDPPPALAAPESPLPYADLQNALSSDAGLLGMLLGGGSSLGL